MAGEGRDGGEKEALAGVARFVLLTRKKTEGREGRLDKDEGVRARQEMREELKILNGYEDKRLGYNSFDLRWHHFCLCDDIKKVLDADEQDGERELVKTREFEDNVSMDQEHFVYECVELPRLTRVEMNQL